MIKKDLVKTKDDSENWKQFRQRGEGDATGAEWEYHGYAIWKQSKGCHPFVTHYRLRKYPCFCFTTLEDACEGIDIIRSRADDR